MVEPHKDKGVEENVAGRGDKHILGNKQTNKNQNKKATKPIIP